MRCRHLCLLAASGLLAACGASTSPIVFDATTAPAPTTSTVAAATVAPTFPLASSTSTASAEVEVSPPAGGTSTIAPTTTAELPGTTVPDAPASADDPTPTSGASTGACTTPGCSGPQIVDFPSLTEVPQLGRDPVRGSGCGLADEFDNSMPDGLYFGSLSPDGGDVSFDVVCVYYGASAIDKGADDSASDFFPVNSGTRERPVPLADGFIYRVGTWAADGACVDAGPSGNADWSTAAEGTFGWLVIAGGDATGAVAMCPL